MKKTISIVFIIVAIILLVRYAGSRNFSSLRTPSGTPYSHETLIMGNENFDALVADTEELKEKGLSGMSGLGEHEAMIFPYAVPTDLPFWMKDMLFSIDMIWLDGNYQVIYFQKDASPDSYPKTFSPNVPAQYVIEVSAGTVDRLGLKVGHKVLLNN